MAHEIDVYRASDEHMLRGYLAAVSHRMPDGRRRTALFKCDLSAQSTAFQMREGLVASGERVIVRNLL